MAAESFSKRLGLAPEEQAEITIRDDAPYHLREAILIIAEHELDLSPSTIRSVLCNTLRKIPDSNNWSQYPNIWWECEHLMENCPWYKVYDFVENMYDTLSKSTEPDRASIWEKLINECFIEQGVGWRLVEGQLESRGPEGFKIAVDTARQSLEDAKLPTAHDEIHEAMKDLSRRPDPDLTGAIHHAMGALECTARTAAGDPKATLGDILKKFPGLLPKPLDDALAQVWGYASEMARHIREGRTPKYAEAEMLVGLAAAVCTYLAAKIRDDQER
jgi:hypothetical protein